MGLALVTWVLAPWSAALWRRVLKDLPDSYTRHRSKLLQPHVCSRAPGAVQVEVSGIGQQLGTEDRAPSSQSLARLSSGPSSSPDPLPFGP